MGLLNRLLRGLPCGCSGTPRAAGARNWRRKHSETCEECRLRERRERQYLERLRGAAVPAASDELTVRLLARTEELARDLPPAPLRDTEVPSGLHEPLRGGAMHGGALHGGARPAIRLTALTAGGAAAAVALMAGSAYLLGGHPVPVEEDMRLSAAAAGTPGAGTAPGWSLTGEPDMTPSGALTAEQLTALSAGTPPERPSPAGNGRLWINPAAPFRAIYQSSAGTFTYVSDQPAEQAGEGVAALVRMPAAPQPETPAAEETTPDGITARIERGLGRILALLAT